MGQLLPVGQAGVNVVEDVEIPLASVESVGLTGSRDGSEHILHTISRGERGTAARGAS